MSNALVGRRSELLQLTELIDAVRAGHSRTLVLLGEAGVGKSALLDETARKASGCLILRTSGVQAEMELAFAGLHQLLMPILHHRHDLPAPQRDALSIAFGMSSGPPPDRFLVGLAVLNLMSSTAEQAPLVCLVDDEQWLDRTSTQLLSFVARRLDADAIALVFATRSPSDDLRGITSLGIEGLAAADAAALLDKVPTGLVDPQIRDQFIHETGGNPLALLELPRGIDPAELAGGFGLPRALTLPGRIENSFAQRVERLPEPSRRVLQLAAADPVGDPALIWRAAEILGLGIRAAETAVESGLINFGVRVQFRHPLARSAAYHSASQTQRLEIHDALARATDPDVDPDRRAWHRAQASTLPDEDTAAELERSALRAGARGGFSAAAAFLENAAILTPASSVRARRMIAAAQAKCDAGTLDGALGLLASVESIPHDDAQSAEVTHLRGRIALDQLRTRDAVQLLRTSATQFGPSRAQSARVALLEAIDAAFTAGEVDGPNGLRELARAAIDAGSAATPLRAVDALLDAVATRIANGHRIAAPKLNELLRSAVGPDATGQTNQDWLPLMRSRMAALLAPDMWNSEAWETLAIQQTQSARQSGALLFLQYTFTPLGWNLIYRGEFDAAAALVSEDRVLAEATGNPPRPYISMLLAAWRGRQTEATSLIDGVLESTTAARLGLFTALCWFTKSLLQNGLGLHRDALDCARQAFAADLLGTRTFAAPELAEAAAHTGDISSLRTVLDWMTEQATTCPTDWALGIEARVRALIGEESDLWHRRSIDHLSRTKLRTEVGRGHLLYGEWLRREGRRVDAREQLRTAEQVLSSIGAMGFADRARRELLATGEKARKRFDNAAANDLTYQEMHVAQLARDGLSNIEIGTRLFISPRTAQYHLGKVFTKLGIRSRGELSRVLDTQHH